MPDSQLQFEEKNRPARLIKTTARDICKVADTIMKPFGATEAFAGVMMMLNSHGEISQMELAKLVNVEQPSMAQLLKRMERDGFVQRVRDENDGRAFLFSLSAHGQKIAPSLMAAFNDANAQMLSGVSQEEYDVFVKVIGRISQNLKNTDLIKPLEK